MVFDPKLHEIDSKTGFAMNKETGYHVGIVPMPPTPVAFETEYPKWVVAHETHVVRQKIDGFPEHISTPSFENFHVNRANGEVTVLVLDQDEEKMAISEKKLPEDDKPVTILEPISPHPYDGAPIDDENNKVIEQKTPVTINNGKA